MIDDLLNPATDLLTWIIERGSRFGDGKRGGWLKRGRQRCRLGEAGSTAGCWRSSNRL